MQATNIKRKKPGPKPKPKLQRIRGYSIALTGSQIKWLESQAKLLNVNVSELVRVIIDKLMNP